MSKPTTALSFHSEFKPARVIELPRTPVGFRPHDVFASGQGIEDCIEVDDNFRRWFIDEYTRGSVWAGDRTVGSVNLTKQWKSGDLGRFIAGKHGEIEFVDVIQLILCGMKDPDTFFCTYYTNVFLMYERTKVLCLVTVRIISGRMYLGARDTVFVNDLVPGTRLFFRLSELH